VGLQTTLDLAYVLHCFLATVLQLQRDRIKLKRVSSNKTSVFITKSTSQVWEIILELHLEANGLYCR